jgi:hypothetical protein
MSNIIRLDVTKGTVKQDLAMLPEKMLDAAYEELLQQAKLMQGLWQVNAPVDTGSYRDSVRIERVGPTRHLHKMVRVRAGGYVTNPKTRRLVDYAAVLEGKYHCGRNAFEQIRGNINSLIQRRVVEACNR